MSLVSEEQKIIAKFLLPNIIELAKEHDNLVLPDKATEQIMLRCIGAGFSLGMAYQQTSKDLPWRERLNEAFYLIREAKQ